MTLLTDLPPLKSPRRLLWAAVLAAWGVVLGGLLVTGGLSRYLASRNRPFVALAAVVMVFLAIVQWRRADVAHHGSAEDPWHEMGCRCRRAEAPRTADFASITLLLLPLLVLAVVPTGTLGAQAARSRGVVAVLPSRNAPSRAPDTTGAAPAASSGADAANAAPGSALAPVPDLTVLDIVYAVASADYAAKVGLSQGAPVKLLGLVVKGGPGSPADGFVLTRFLVTCCVADAVPIGVRVTGPGAAGFADNTWVIVEGALTWQKATGLVKPGQVLADIAVTKIEPTAAPADAYVY